MVARYDLVDRSVLEVGSYNVNGSVRSCFIGPYVGVDMRSGPGVDQVAEASFLPFDAESFDVVISTEMLEHCGTFWLSLREMARVLRPGGHLILTARGNGFPEHREPQDFYRFYPAAFEALFEWAGLQTMEVIDDTDPTAPGVFGLAVKA